MLLGLFLDDLPEDERRELGLLDEDDDQRDR